VLMRRAGRIVQHWIASLARSGASSDRLRG
jgi:hypothetical protein